MDQVVVLFVICEHCSLLMNWDVIDHVYCRFFFRKVRCHETDRNEPVIILHEVIDALQLIYLFGTKIFRSGPFGLISRDREEHRLVFKVDLQHVLVVLSLLL